MEETIVRDESLVKQAEEMMEKQEFGERRLSGLAFRITFLIAIAFSCFQMYTAFFGVLTSTLQRSVHLSFAITLCFLFYPFSKRSKRKTIPSSISCSRPWPAPSVIYVTVFYEQLVRRIGDPTPVDLVMGVLTIVLILEASRRAVGWPLVIITGLFILYGLFGPYMPGILAHRGYSFRRIVDHLYLTGEGIFGIPLWVSSTFVFAFVLLRRHLRKDRRRRVPHEAGHVPGRAHARRPGQGLGRGERLHGDHLRQRGGQHGHDRHPHHPADEEGGVQARAGRRHRHGRGRQRPAHAARHGGGRLRHGRVPGHPLPGRLRGRGAAGGDRPAGAAGGGAPALGQVRVQGRPARPAAEVHPHPDQRAALPGPDRRPALRAGGRAADPAHGGRDGDRRGRQHLHVRARGHDRRGVAPGRGAGAAAGAAGPAPAGRP